MDKKIADLEKMIAQLTRQVNLLIKKDNENRATIKRLKVKLERHEHSISTLSNNISRRVQ